MLIASNYILNIYKGVDSAKTISCDTRRKINRHARTPTCQSIQRIVYLVNSGATINCIGASASYKAIVAVITQQSIITSTSI